MDFPRVVPEFGMDEWYVYGVITDHNGSSHQLSVCYNTRLLPGKNYAVLIAQQCFDWHGAIRRPIE